MFDFRQSKDLEDLMARFYETGRFVSTVCHGATGLLNVNLSTGEPLVKGKKVTDSHGLRRYWLREMMLSLST